MQRQFGLPWGPGQGGPGQGGQSGFPGFGPPQGPSPQGPQQGSPQGFPPGPPPGGGQDPSPDFQGFGGLVFKLSIQVQCLAAYIVLLGFA
ncbi:hypothetical protein [Halobacillus amylolyticus]|uniref:Uncharacterized protein n=1 Tax=Halobacillus amylolyticus TaxID=2932259 RepID=A0ABY4HEC3_9BACI|nr:hypothetical protein [Halobacillus amylolyticus]UOR13240.1 hypothetical protein MUO15_07055 [Halobacillus amylolyticus]